MYMLHLSLRLLHLFLCQITGVDVCKCSFFFYRNVLLHVYTSGSCSLISCPLSTSTGAGGGPSLQRQIKRLIVKFDHLHVRFLNTCRGLCLYLNLSHVKLHLNSYFSHMKYLKITRAYTFTWTLAGFSRGGCTSDLDTWNSSLGKRECVHCTCGLTCIHVSEPNTSVCKALHMLCYLVPFMLRQCFSGPSDSAVCLFLLVWWHSVLRAEVLLLVQHVVPVLSLRDEVFCPLQGGADGALRVDRLYGGHQQYLQVKHTWTIIDAHASQIMCIQFLQVIRFALRARFPGDRSHRGWWCGWWWWRWWWWSQKLSYLGRNGAHWEQCRYSVD